MTENNFPAMDAEVPVDDDDKASLTSSVASIQRHRLISKVLSGPTNGLHNRFKNARSLKEYYNRQKEREKKSTPSSNENEENPENEKETPNDLEQIDKQRLFKDGEESNECDNMKENMIENRVSSSLREGHMQVSGDPSDRSNDKPQSSVSYIQPFQSTTELELEETPAPPLTNSKPKVRKSGTSKRRGALTDTASRGDHCSREDKENDHRTNKYESNKKSSRDARKSFTDRTGSEGRKGSRRGIYDMFGDGAFLWGMCGPVQNAAKSAGMTACQSTSYDDIVESGSSTAEQALRSVRYLSERSSALHQQISQTWTQESFDSYLDFVEQNFPMTMQTQNYEESFTLDARNQTMSTTDTESNLSHLNESNLSERDTAEITVDSLEAEAAPPTCKASSTASFEVPKKELIELMHATVAQLVTNKNDESLRETERSMDSNQ